MFYATVEQQPVLPPPAPLVVQSTAKPHKYHHIIHKHKRQPAAKQQDCAPAKK